MPESPRTEARAVHAEGLLSALGWNGRLDQAANAPEVVGVVKDYLAQWTPEELARLPERCRPGRLVDEEDLSHLALQIAVAQRSGAQEVTSELERLGHFLGSAMARLSQVLARTSAESTD